MRAWDDEAGVYSRGEGVNAAEADGAEANHDAITNDTPQAMAKAKEGRTVRLLAVRAVMWDFRALQADDVPPLKSTVSRAEELLLASFIDIGETRHKVFRGEGIGLLFSPFNSRSLCLLNQT